MWSWLADWIKEGLIGGIMGNFQGMFDEVNTKVGEIAVQVGTPPSAWNSSIFNMIKTLSDTVIVPVAGMILTFVLCYELIHMIIDRNNMHDIDTFIFFKWIFKTFVAVFILTHTFDLVMGIFSLAQQVINGSAGIISGSLNMPLSMSNLEATLQTKEWYDLLGLYVESGFLSLGMKVMSIFIFILVYGRMIEIYLTVSIAPIPFSTMANSEWGQIGKSYLKGLFALAFQGFLIMVCVAIYAALLQSITAVEDVRAGIWFCVGYTILLIFSIMKTNSLSRQLFGAH
jgi:hypothetical protein